MKIIATFLLLSLIPFTVSAGDCTREIPVAVVDKKNTLIDYVVSDLKDRTLKESFTLVSGQNVQIIQSGCHHFRLKYEFEVSVLPQEAIIPTAIKLFKPLTNFSTFNAKRIMRALNGRVGKNFIDTITITEDYEWLYISQVKNNGINKMVLYYDVAL